MQTIPAPTVEQIWEQVMSWSEEEAEAKMQSVASRQPAVIAYLLHAEEEFIPPDDQGFIVHLGAFIVEVMSPARRPLPPVSGPDIESAEEENLRWAESMSSKAESNEDEVVSIFPENHPQLPLLHVLAEAVMSSQEEDSETPPENLGLILLHLKTVVDCLQKAGQE